MKEHREDALIWMWWDLELWGEQEKRVNASQVNRCLAVKDKGFW
jgi:hypothetical protein